MGHDILIVDDERDICTLIAGILEDEGHTARRAHNSTEATDAVRQRRPALVILDVWLQGSEMDGLQLLEEIRREDPPIPVVMISGHGTIDTAVSAIKNGAYDFIEKPFKADRLLLVVDRAGEAHRLRREHATLRRRAGRVTAPTTHALQGEIRAGPFRKELFPRYTVVALPVPPLSERRGEIPGLATELLRCVADATGLAARPMGEDTLAALQGHDWPGN